MPCRGVRGRAKRCPPIVRLARPLRTLCAACSDVSVFSSTAASAKCPAPLQGIPSRRAVRHPEPHLTQRAQAAKYPATPAGHSKPKGRQPPRASSHAARAGGKVSGAPAGHSNPKGRQPLTASSHAARAGAKVSGPLQGIPSRRAVSHPEPHLTQHEQAAKCPAPCRAFQAEEPAATHSRVSRSAHAPSTPASSPKSQGGLGSPGVPSSGP